MKKSILFSLIYAILIFLLAACGARQGASGQAAVTIEATVQAAGAATATAQVKLQATIDAAVQATTAAIPAPAATPIVITQVVTQTAYVPKDVYMSMTEEELAKLINTAVDQATAATQTSSATATTATSDGTLTTSDVATIQVYVQQADVSVAYAEELVTAYHELYGDTADEVLQAVNSMEADLSTIAQSTAAMSTSLDEIETTLNSGLELAQSSVDQLEQAAATATSAASELQNQAETLVNTVANTVQTKAATHSQTAQDAKSQFTNIVQQIKPQEIAGDQVGAFHSVFTYMDTVRNALGDNTVSTPEMQAIAQTGANAFASLNAHGGPRWSNVSPTINDVTNAVARGDLDRARQGLHDVESRLPARDSVGGLAKPGNDSKDGPNKPGKRRP